MAGYETFSSRKQLSVVRRALEDLLASHGQADLPLSLVLNAYNVTFALETPSGKLAIRVNTGSTRSASDAAGELAWIAAIAHEGLIQVPEPVPLIDGSPVTCLTVEGIDRPVLVVAYRWLEGRHVGKNRPSRHAFLLGQLMSRLHEMAGRFELPPGTSRPTLQNVIDGLPWRLPDSGPFREVFERANAILSRFEQLPRRLVHFDLHFGNVKVSRGEMSAFDFDDCLFAWPGVDAAQAMFYLRRGGPDDRLETAFWEGAGTSVGDLGLSREDFEMLIGGRALLLATDLAGTTSATLAAMAPEYIEVTRRRLEHLLKEGVFEPSVAKMGG